MNGVKMAVANEKECKERKSDPSDGTWLCEKGPYQEYIASLIGSNPGLEKPDPKNKDHPLKPGNATVVLLEAPASGQPGFKKQQFKNSSELKRHFHTADHDHSLRRVYIMEGLAQDYISLIGGHFFIDPTFFLRQERTCVWSNKFTPTRDALPQPSLLDPESSFHLQFCELRHFKQKVPNEPYFCHRTGRHVGMNASRQEEDSTTAILRRKVSFWCRETTNGGWDVVILCDPQLVDLWGKGRKWTEYTNIAFQGGYVDFLPCPSADRVRSKPRHPHDCMLKDLCHYFENHSDLIDEQEWQSPIASSLFVKKIVAAYYLQLVDYIKVMLPSLELRLTTAWVEEQDQWKSLQTISRRCGNYRDDMEDVLLSLGYSLKEVESHKTGDWKDCEKDFQYVYFRLKILKQRADTLMQAMTGLASIAGNRQNLEEAKRVKRLNLLALLFIPLAYTSSLFSMSDGFTPGDRKFWIYWVSSIPVIAFTFLATFVMDFTLDDTANWTWDPLKFWKKDKGVPKKQVRTRTGLWDKRAR
ncbi:hypothetical protein K469DRAFT_663185 [Zopfia rhizophila CBS 207.26]|uniref:Cora-domain-containing protein n=1 Tax=Zopfia rhizophila CBS 207.26 TaxID=1314779 RepID=A0A6A6E9A9_9PEZI|nr:hypothetical protein K469DRAFT_663185 [Zopfia rhizophila CBS 207.26]